MSSRRHFLLLPIATLLFALGVPTTVRAQNPCAGSGTPTPKCLAWMEQQKLNAACSQNPNKPECKDWLKKQQGGKPASKRLGSPDTKAFKRDGGSSKSPLAVQKLKKPK